MNVILSQFNFGPKKLFCDAIINRVQKVEKAVETIEDKFVELVMAMCRQILKVCRLPPEP